MNIPITPEVRANSRDRVTIDAVPISTSAILGRENPDASTTLTSRLQPNLHKLTGITIDNHIGRLMPINRPRRLIENGKRDLNGSNEGQVQFLCRNWKSKSDLCKGNQVGDLFHVQGKGLHDRHYTHP